MAGIPMVTPGPISSAATGIAMPNMFAQAAQALEQYPQQQQVAEANRMKIETAQRTLAQGEYDRTLQMIKGNPALAKSPIVIKKVQDLSKVLGLIAPMDQGGGTGTQQNVSPPASAATDLGTSGGVTGGSGASPSSAPPSVPSFSGQMPGAPGRTLAGRQTSLPAGGAPDAAAPVAMPDAPPVQGAMPQSAPPQTPGLDLQALLPSQTFTELMDKSPNFMAAAQNMNIASKHAFFANIPGTPAAFLNQPMQLNTHQMLQLRSIQNEFTTELGKGNTTPEQVQRLMHFYAPMLRQWDMDPSELLQGLDVKSTLGPAIQARIQSLQQAGIINAERANSYVAQGVARIENLGTSSALNRVKATYLPMETQAKIQNMQSQVDTRAQNLQNAAQRITIARQHNNLIAAGQATMEYARDRAALLTQIGQLRGEAKALYASGTDDALDPVTQQPLVNGIADKINSLTASLDAMDKQVGGTSSNQSTLRTMQNSIPGATHVSGGKNWTPPPGAMPGKLGNNQPGYAIGSGANAIYFDAQGNQTDVNGTPLKQ